MYKDFDVSHVTRLEFHLQLISPLSKYIFVFIEEIMFPGEPVIIMQLRGLHEI